MAEHLVATKRDQYGKRSAKNYRRNGQVPGIIYSGGKDAESLLFNNRELVGYLSQGHGLNKHRSTQFMAALACYLTIKLYPCLGMDRKYDMDPFFL